MVTDRWLEWFAFTDRLIQVPVEAQAQDVSLREADCLA